MCCSRLSCTLIENYYKLIKISTSASLYMSRTTRMKIFVLYCMLLTVDITLRYKGEVMYNLDWETCFDIRSNDTLILTAPTFDEHL
jgi:predicted membrane-bound mannosyltransferase